MAGCDETFHPLKENDNIPFSIYGYLESPADTNWIRVSEVRNILYLDENATIDAEVTLEHLESGRLEILQDSLVRYQGELYAFNFRSIMPLEPEQTYLLKAERSDGQTSSATITLPSTFPDPDIQIFENGFIRAEIEMIEHLAAVDIIYEVRNNETGHSREFRFHHRHNTHIYPPIFRLANVNPQRHLDAISDYYNVSDTPYTILQRWLYIASADENWIDFPALDPLVKELPELGNVKNGTGYLTGIVSRTFAMPCDFCRQED